jgi:hypothetical protein
MKTFGFPQIMRDGGGGDGGGGAGADGDWEDAYASANDHTDFSSNSVGLGGLANSDFSSMEPDMGFDEVGFGNVDWGSYGPAVDIGDRGFSQSFSPGFASYGPNQGTAQESDPFGFGAHGTFGQPSSFDTAWGNLGVGYNNPGTGDPFGFGPTGDFGRGGPSVDVVGWNDFNAIDRAAPPNADLSWATSPAESFHERSSPFAGRFGAIGQQVSDWSNTPFGQPSQGWGYGPPIAGITVNPSQSNPGTFDQAMPGQATPATANFGLPAATHPGARAGEIDWAAVSNAGLNSISSNTRANVSPEMLAYDQARSIPQQISPTDWFSEARGNVSPELLEMEAAQSRPYQMPWGWMSNTRGNLSEDDPEVQAVIARMRG